MSACIKRRPIKESVKLIRRDFCIPTTFFDAKESVFMMVPIE